MASMESVNSVTGAGSLLDKIWNFGSNTIERGLSYVMEREQTERMIKLREAEAAAESAKRNSYVQLESAAQAASAMVGSQYVPYMLAGLAGLTAYVVLKRK